MRDETKVKKARLRCLDMLRGGRVNTVYRLEEVEVRAARKEA